MTDAELAFVATMRDEASQAARGVRANLDRVGGPTKPITTDVRVDADQALRLLDALPKSADGAVDRTSAAFAALSPKLRKTLADTEAEIRRGDAFGALPDELRAAITAAEAVARTGGKSISNAVEAGVDLGPAMRAEGEEGGRSLSAGLSDGISSSKGRIAGAIGALGVGALFAESLSIESAGDKLAASLGATPAEAQRYARLAGNLYAGAWGESIDEVNTAIGSVSTSIEGVGQGKELRAATIQALDFATAFEVDVVRAAQVAGTAVRVGLAKDAGQAFDLLTVASQRVPTALREDLLDATDEYGTFFASLGFSGEEAFRVLAEGAERGTYGLDKAGDAVKELTIRSTDLSDTSRDAYRTLGLDAEATSDKILAGGDVARGAFGEIVDGLLSIESPSKRANTAIALFGTPLEDLNVREIPQFLRSLQSADQGLGRVEGAAKRAGQTLNDNTATDVKALGREAKQLGTDLVGSAAPGLREAVDAARPLVDLVGKLSAGFSKLDPKLQTAVVGLGAAALAVGPITRIGAGAATGLTAVASGLGLVSTKSGDVDRNAGGAASRISKLGGVARVAGGAAGLGLMAAGASSANDSTRTLANVGGAALTGFALAGPIGGAIGAGAGLLWDLEQASQDSTDAIRDAARINEDYIGTLDQTNAAIRKETKAAIYRNLVRNDALWVSRSLGIADREVVNASAGQVGAYKRITAAVREATAGTKANRKAGAESFFNRQSAADYLSALRNNSKQLSAEQRQLLEVINATKSWGQALRGVPKQAQAELKLLGYKPTIGELRNLAREYKLTPKEIRTIIKATGVDATVKDVRGVRKEIEDTSNAKYDPKTFKGTLSAGIGDAIKLARKGADTATNELEEVRKARAHMALWVGGITTGAAEGTRRAKAGGESVSRGLVEEPNRTRANLGVLNGSISSGLATVRNTAATGGRGVGAAMKSGIEGGLSGVVSSIVGTASSAVSQAIAAARRAAQARSPSRKMIELGEDMGEGLNVGLRRKVPSNRKAAAKSVGAVLGVALRGLIGGSGEAGKTLGKLEKEIGRFYDKRIKDDRDAEQRARKAIADLRKRTAAVRDQAKEYDRLVAKIKAAEQRGADFSRSILDATGAASVESVNDAPITAGFIDAGLRDQLAKVEAFRKDLADLRGRGLSAASLEEIEARGLDEGAAYAAALAAGTDEQLRSINASQAAIAKEAKRAGQQSVAGLIEGIDRNVSKAERAATRLAKALRKAIRKELGIKSPSTKLAEDGDDTVAGFALGLSRSTKVATREGERLAASVRASARTDLAGPRAGSLAGGRAGGAVSGTLTVRHIVTSPDGSVTPMTAREIADLLAADPRAAGMLERSLAPARARRSGRTISASS